MCAWNPANDQTLATLGTITPDPNTPDSHIIVSLNCYTSDAQRKKGEHGEVKLSLARITGGKNRRLGRLSEAEAVALVELLAAYNNRRKPEKTMEAQFEAARAALTAEAAEVKPAASGKKRRTSVKRILTFFEVSDDKNTFYCLNGGKTPGKGLLAPGTLSSLGFQWDGEDDNCWYVDDTLWEDAKTALMSKRFTVISE